MSEAALDLELVVSKDRAVTIPPRSWPGCRQLCPASASECGSRKRPLLAGRCSAHSRSRGEPR